MTKAPTTLSITNKLPTSFDIQSFSELHFEGSFEITDMLSEYEHKFDYSTSLQLTVDSVNQRFYNTLNNCQDSQSNCSFNVCASNTVNYYFNGYIVETDVVSDRHSTKAKLTLHVTSDILFKEIKSTLPKRVRDW